MRNEDKFYANQPLIVLCHFPTLTCENSIILDLVDYYEAMREELKDFLLENLLHPELSRLLPQAFIELFEELDFAALERGQIIDEVIEREMATLVEEVTTTYKEHRRLLNNKVLYDIDILFPKSIAFIFVNK